MEKVLSDGTKVVVYDKEELPMRSTRIIERTQSEVSAAIERLRKLSDVPQGVTTFDWWQSASDEDREAIYAKATQEEKDAMEHAQDVLIIGMVKSWSGDPLTIENVSMLPQRLYLELAIFCTENAVADTDFSSDKADDPKVPTDNSGLSTPTLGEVGS